MRRNNAARIQEFADDLRNFVEMPTAASRFGLQERLKFDDEKITKILNDAVMATTLVAKIAKEVEFYIQGDVTPETFLKRYEKLEEELRTELA